MVSLVVCGAINWDISCFVERLPVPGEEVTIENITRVSGGTGGNIAVAAARILGAKEVALIGALGKDDIASKLLPLRTKGLSPMASSILREKNRGRLIFWLTKPDRTLLPVIWARMPGSVGNT